MRTTLYLIMGFGWLTAGPLSGQFETHLSPVTQSDYQNYLKGVESELAARWQGSRPLLSLDQDSDDKARAHQGELVIVELSNSKTPSIRNGRVHDWVGTAFIRGVTVARVLSILSDFDRHKDFYPDVVQSNLVSRQGNRVTGRWRLKRTKIITVELEVDQQADYVSLAPGVWTVRSHATRIREVQSPGEASEKLFPPGEGNGFLWRLDSYWTLRQEADGVYAECRTVSLSRSIPASLAWVIKPLLESMPRESLASTLRSTRDAASNQRVSSSSNQLPSATSAAR
ncbi:MAG: hypothetical protein WBW33_32805 [Bryobacteraceae bacterium]